MRTQFGMLGGPCRALMASADMFYTLSCAVYAKKLLLLSSQLSLLVSGTTAIEETQHEQLQDRQHATAPTASLQRKPEWWPVLLQSLGRPKHTTKHAKL